MKDACARCSLLCFSLSLHRSLIGCYAQDEADGSQIVRWHVEIQVSDFEWHSNDVTARWVNRVLVAHFPNCIDSSQDRKQSVLHVTRFDCVAENEEWLYEVITIKLHQRNCFHAHEKRRQFIRESRPPVVGKAGRWIARWNVKDVTTSLRQTSRRARHNSRNAIFFGHFPLVSTHCTCWESLETLRDASEVSQLDLVDKININIKSFFKKILKNIFFWGNLREKKKFSVFYKKIMEEKSFSSKMLTSGLKNEKIIHF